MPKLAIIQQAPVVLDRVATLQEAVRWVDTAAAAGAALIVLPESFVPCYPAWIWRLRPKRSPRCPYSGAAIVAASR